MAIGRVVPWCSWEEWGAVYRDLFANSISQKNTALYQLAVWRCRGKVPLAVEITGSLIEVNVRDQYSRDHSGASDDVTRLEYSMAIVRMVNGISDKAQKGKTAVSVSHNAATAGLPRLLVDVRHEASHNDMPSLSLLRLAAAQALDWLQAAYWQRQEAYLLQQKGRVVQLLQDLVTLKRSSSLGQRKSGPSQEATGTGNVTQPGIPASLGDWRHADCVLSEEGHEQQAVMSQQAVLSQLKEVPIKSMNASLLVAPLLDHGVMESCLSNSASSKQHPTNQQTGGEFFSVIQCLSRHWPSLPALLLHQAVRRLCQLAQPQPHTHAHDASVLAAWVKLLLESSSTGKGQQTPQKGQQAPQKGQHPSPGGTRAGKRKSHSSDPKAPEPSSESSGYSLTGVQLRACMGMCLTALPACKGQTAAAVRQVLLQLLQHLQHEYPSEYADWGHTAQALAASCCPQGGLEGLAVGGPVLQVVPRQDEQSSHELSTAQQRQQSLLGELCTSDDGTDRLSQDWELVADWTPCAIGALPSAFDPNGCQPAFPPAQPPRPLAASPAEVSKPQPNAMAFALQSSHPGCHIQQPGEEPVDLVASEEVSLTLGVVSDTLSAEVSGSDECLYVDYWRRFEEHGQDVEQPVSTSEALNHMPLKKAVKVL